LLEIDFFELLTMHSRTQTGRWREEGVVSVFHFLMIDSYKGESDPIFIEGYGEYIQKIHRV
jgi:hypothetical protein